MFSLQGDSSSSASFKWSIYRTVSGDDSIGSYDNFLVNASLSSDTSVLQRSVVFPSHTLKFDTLYNVSLSVLMLEMPEVSVVYILQSY